MKTRSTILGIAAVLALAATSFAGPNPPGIQPEVQLSNRPMYYRMASSVGACATSLAFSKNPGKAAEIGVPILIVGSLLAAKLFHNHPRLSGLLQFGSGAGCVAGALAVHAPAPVGFVSTPNGVGNNGPITGPGGSLIGGNTGSSDSSSSGGDTTGGSGGGSSVGGGSNGTSGGGSSNGPGPGCIAGGGHDCGFPGNGGNNPGNGVGTTPTGYNNNKP